MEGVTALEASLARYPEKATGGKIFKLLLENGASITNLGGQCQGSSVIWHTLIKEDSGDLIDLAVKAGANVNHMSPGNGGRTPLQLAAEKGDIKLIKLLLELGANVNAQPGYILGGTALQAAASCDRPQIELIQFLIDNRHFAVANFLRNHEVN